MTNFGWIPDQNCWNIFKLAVKLLPGLPQCIKAKIHVTQHECIGESENTFITRHLCPHYSFGGDVKHLEFLMGLDDLEKDV